MTSALTPLETSGKPQHTPKPADGFHSLSAIVAGAIAASLFLGLYYLLLGALPPTALQPDPSGSGALWKTHFDISQFVGSLIDPPYPTSRTWALGFTVLYAALVSGAFIYALILKWARRSSTSLTSVGFATTGFVGAGFTIWLGMGLQPAVMNGSLPDPGFFLLGWSGWATLHLALCFLAYGAILGCSMSKLGVRPS